MQERKGGYPLYIREFFDHYDPGCPYHCSSLSELQDAMPEELLNSDAEWFKTWSWGGRR